MQPADILCTVTRSEETLEQQVSAHGQKSWFYGLPNLGHLARFNGALCFLHISSRKCGHDAVWVSSSPSSPTEQYPKNHPSIIGRRIINRMLLQEIRRPRLPLVGEAVEIG